MSRTTPESDSSHRDAIGCPANASSDDELIGRVIGSYRVTKLLGRGGMGAVYVAEHPLIGSRVAIKFLHPQYAADRKIVERFFNEARAVNLIGHDNILKILDLDVTDDGRHYFVMELLQGRTLHELVQGGEPLPLETAGPIVLQVCDALQAAHENGIVHRDLKPDNIHLTIHRGRKNFVKVMDFGIARLADRQGSPARRTEAGIVLGTPAYMSPEQAAGRADRIDGRSDVYSLGCTMFQMATGNVPFAGTGFGELLVAQLQLPPPRPRALVPAIPEAYEAVILKCLEKKPEDRYQSMRELHDTVAQVMAQLGVSRELPAARPAEIEAARTAALAASPKPGRSRRSARLLWLGAGAGAVAIAGGFAVLVAQQLEENRRQVERARLAAERLAEQAQESARRAEKERALQEERVQLSILSDPPGATVEAAWNGGFRAAVTPFELQVPRNASVHLAFSKPEFAPMGTDVIADAAKVVRASLSAQAKTAVRRPPPAKPVEKKPREARQASAEMKDDTIPVEF